MNLRNFMIFAVFLFLSCCSLRKAEIVLVGDDKKFIEVKNGSQVLVSDTIHFSAITAWPKNNNLLGKKHRIKWNRPIQISFLDIRSNYSGNKRVRLKPNQYIIIDITGVHFNVYSSDKKYGGI